MRTGRNDTQTPSRVMSPPRQCPALHLEASFKPLPLTAEGMSCHQHSSLMKEKKVKWKVSSSYTPSVLSTPCAFKHRTRWSSLRVQGNGDFSFWPGAYIWEERLHFKMMFIHFKETVIHKRCNSLGCCVVRGLGHTQKQPPLRLHVVILTHWFSTDQTNKMQLAILWAFPFLMSKVINLAE